MPKRSRKSDDDFESLRKSYKKAKKLRKRKRRQRSKENRTPLTTPSESPELQDSQDSEPTLFCSPMVDSNIPDAVRYAPEADSGLATNNPLVEDVINIDITGDEPSPSEITPEEVLDSDTLEILGEDPTIVTIYGKDIQKDLAIRLQHITTTGLTKNERKELMEKYPIPNNAKLIDAPILNAEMKAPACLSESVLKRDQAIFFKQKQISAAIAGLSEALSLIIASKQKNPTLLKILMDTERILCDIQHGDSMLRRSYITSALKKDMRDQIRLTKVDSHLFGENLLETVKSAKAISASAAYLKSNAAPKLPQKRGLYNTTKHLNQKGPFPARRQQGPPRTSHYQPAPSARRQPSSSSKQYRPPAQHQGPPPQPYSRGYRR